MYLLCLLSTKTNAQLWSVVTNAQEGLVRA